MSQTDPKFVFAADVSYQMAADWTGCRGVSFVRYYPLGVLQLTIFLKMQFCLELSQE